MIKNENCSFLLEKKFQVFYTFDALLLVSIFIINFNKFYSIYYITKRNI